MATLSPIQQPELRAYPCFDRLPHGCTAVPIVNDRCEPILHAGEFVVVDAGQRDPEHEELVAIRWTSGAVDVLCAWFTRRSAPVAGFWAVGMVKPQQLRDLTGELQGAAIRWADWPYSEARLRDRIIGRVVGILRPSFDGSGLRKVN